MGCSRTSTTWEGIACLCAVIYLSACSRSSVGPRDGRADLAGDDLSGFVPLDFSSPEDLVVEETFCTGDPFCEHRAFRSSPRARAGEESFLTAPDDAILSGVQVAASGEITLSPGASSGTYSVLVAGARCGGEAATAWIQVSWTTAGPSGETVSVRARTADTPDLASPLWKSAAYTAPSMRSPLDLAPPRLVPNSERESVGRMPVLNGYLWIEVQLQRYQGGGSPVLDGLDVYHETMFCEG